MVMNLTALRSHEDQYVLEDIAAVREAAGKDILKVIIEAPQLTGEEIHRAVNLCIQAGADYVKTSTGWYPSHPSVLSHIQLMSDAAKGRIKIKAAGGIRTLETIRAMEKAGCDRFFIRKLSLIFKWVRKRLLNFLSHWKHLFLKNIVWIHSNTLSCGKYFQVPSTENLGCTLPSRVTSTVN